MQSSLSRGCTIKIQNFEGPFDLLFHLLEKNKINIYDIPISIIADQYMEYLFAMQKLDLEITSEFLIIASTLLHIKSKMLLPQKKEEKQEEEKDPREELVLKLVEYKKFKELAEELKSKEGNWNKVYYKLPEVIEFKREQVILNLCPDQLLFVYKRIIEKEKRKRNNVASKMTEILQKEKVSLKSKMIEIAKELMRKVVVKFSDVFTLANKSKVEVVTGFLAILELTKLKKVKLDQDKSFSDIFIEKLVEDFEDLEYIQIDKEAADE